MTRSRTKCRPTSGAGDVSEFQYSRRRRPNGQKQLARLHPDRRQTDAKKAAPDGLTPLHEMGHCVGLRHAGDGSQLAYGEDDNFMGYGQFKTNDTGYTNERLNRQGCHPWQIVALRTAYFYTS